MNKLILLHTDTLKKSVINDSFFLTFLGLIFVSLIFFLYKYLKK